MTTCFSDRIFGGIGFLRFDAVCVVHQLYVSFGSSVAPFWFWFWFGLVYQLVHSVSIFWYVVQFRLHIILFLVWFGGFGYCIFS